MPRTCGLAENWPGRLAAGDVDSEVADSRRTAVGPGRTGALVGKADLDDAAPAIGASAGGGAPAIRLDRNDYEAPAHGQAEARRKRPRDGVAERAGAVLGEADDRCGRRESWSAARIGQLGRAGCDVASAAYRGPRKRDGRRTRDRGGCRGRRG